MVNCDSFFLLSFMLSSLAAVSASGPGKVWLVGQWDVWCFCLLRSLASVVKQLCCRHRVASLGHCFTVSVWAFAWTLVVYASHFRCVRLDIPLPLPEAPSASPAPSSPCYCFPHGVHGGWLLSVVLQLRLVATLLTSVWVFIVSEVDQWRCNLIMSCLL